MHLGSFLHRSQAIVTSQQKSTGFRTFTSSGQPSSRQYFLGSFGGNGSISVPWRPAISFAICVLRFKVHSTASSKRGYLDAPARSLQLKRGLNNKQLCQNCQNCQTTKAKKSNSEILPQTENLIMGFIRQNAAAGLKTVRNSPESFYNPSQSISAIYLKISVKTASAEENCAAASSAMSSIERVLKREAGEILRNVRNLI